MLKVVTGAFSFVVIFFSFIYIANSPLFLVQDVILEGEGIEGQDVRKIINEVMGEKILGFFPKSNFLLYPTKELSQKIQQKFSSVKNVSAVKIGLDKMILKLEKRKPIWQVCGLNSCMFVDKEGYLFEDSSFSGDPMLSIKIASDLKEGDLFLGDKIDKISFLLNSLSQRNFEVISADISEYEDVSFYNIEKVRISFDLNSDLVKAISHLDAVLYEINDREIKSGFSGIKYIDLRFGNKVFVKKDDNLR